MGYTKTSSCPHCGAPIYAVVQENPWRTTAAPMNNVPTTAYSCACNYNRLTGTFGPQPQIQVVPQTLEQALEQESKKEFLEQLEKMENKIKKLVDKSNNDTTDKKPAVSLQDGVGLEEIDVKRLQKMAFQKDMEKNTKVVEQAVTLNPNRMRELAGIKEPLTVEQQVENLHKVLPNIEKRLEAMNKILKRLEGFVELHNQDDHHSGEKAAFSKDEEPEEVMKKRIKKTLLLEEAE